MPGQELTENGLTFRKNSGGFGTWRYDFTVDGVRYKKTIGSSRGGVTLSSARAVVLQVRAKAADKRICGLTGQSSLAQQAFREVAQDFLSWGETHYQEHRLNVSRMNNYLLPTFGDKRLCDITTGMIEEMRSQMRLNGLSVQTTNRVVSLLSSTFNFAQKSDPNLDNPTIRLSSVRYQKKEVVPFTRSESDALLNVGAVQVNTITRGSRKGEKSIDPYKTKEFKVIVGLALFAGLRASEALGLSWEDVDFVKGSIYIHQIAKEGVLRDSTKSYKSRAVPISRSLKPLLLALWEEHVAMGRENGLVLSRDGAKPYNQIQAMFGRIRQQAGIDKGKGYHTLRHTFATRAAENNVDIPTLQKLLGHSSITVTMGYVHTTEEHLGSSARKLD